MSLYKDGMKEGLLSQKGVTTGGDKGMKPVM